MTTTGSEVLTWEVLKTCLRKKACLQAGSVYWYVGVFIAFTELTGGIETVLTERLAKISLNTFKQILTAHSLKWVTEALQMVWFTETWTQSFLAPREEL